MLEGILYFLLAMAAVSIWVSYHLDRRAADSEGAKIPRAPRVAWPRQVSAEA
jgi:hypothetical protein